MFIFVLQYDHIKNMATKSSIAKNNKTVAKKATTATSTIVMTAKKSTKSKIPNASIKTENARERTVGVNPISSYPSMRQKLDGMRIKRSYLIAILAAIIVLVVVYSIRGWFVAALVNGQPIYRLDVINQLEQQYGDQEMQSLVTQALIQQAASQRHITVSQQEINSQITTIENNLKKQGETLDSALQQQHMTRQQLTDQIVLQQEIQKMVGKVVVTNQQVKDYMSQNKGSLPAGTTTSQVNQQLQQQELQQKEQQFVTDLQTHAHITSWVDYYSG